MTGFLVTLGFAFIAITVAFLIKNNQLRKKGIAKEIEIQNERSIMADRIQQMTEATSADEYSIFDFTIAGTYFLPVGDKVNLNNYTEVTDSLILEREPYNPKNKKAIVIHSEYGKLGYVPDYLLSHFYTPSNSIRNHKAFITNIDGRVGDLFVEARVIFLDGKGLYYF